MRQQEKIKTMVISALLCAIGIIIPMFAPKIVLGPASFTLASHVPIFIAVFISPIVAVSVALITGVGFLLAGFPIVIVLRALTHIVFALVGALILKKRGNLLSSFATSIPFGLGIGVIHAACEVLVVTWFYLGGGMGGANYQYGYFVSVVVLVGLGTVVHSMVDYFIAVFLWKPLQRVVAIPVSARV